MSHDLEGIHIATRGREYPERALIRGGPYDGKTARTSPTNDHLYIQDRDAVWVYVKRSTDQGQPVYELDHSEPPLAMEP